jgi:hypothetical protein
MDQGPIFIHSLWRSGSTYVWNRFRAAPELYAYYEPFHEALLWATEADLAAWTPDSWSSGHPPLGRPYFAEFLPMIAGRGLPGFAKSFSLDHNFEDDPQTLAGEERYVASLIDHARLQGKIALFGCCRTLGRVPWLKRRFGGTHLVLSRDPRQQWYSGHLRKVEHGNAYFDLMPFQILGKSEWEPARRIARTLGIDRFDAASFYLEHDRYFALYAGAAAERSYAAFSAVNGLSLARASPASDLAIDIDRLSADAPYRAAVQQRIGTLTGLAVDFADARIADHPIPQGLADFGRVERAVAALID